MSRVVIAKHRWKHDFVYRSVFKRFGIDYVRINSIPFQLDLSHVHPISGILYWTVR